MAKRVVIEEFHVTFYVAPRLSEVECRAVRRTLNHNRFRAQLKEAIAKVMKRHGPLRKVLVSLTR